MSSTYVQAHSGSLISGSPKVGDDVIGYLDEFESIFQSAVDTALAFARNDLRATAEQNQAWKNYASLLDVEFDGDNFVYVMTGDPDENQAMQELEFGGANQAPNSLIRKAALKHPHFIGQIMSDALSGSVPVA